MQLELEDIPVVVNTQYALSIVHAVTMTDEAPEEDRRMANSLLSAIIPELRYPTTALKPCMRDTYKRLKERYG